MHKYKDIVDAYRRTSGQATQKKIENVKMARIWIEGTLKALEVPSDSWAYDESYEVPGTSVIEPTAPWLRVDRAGTVHGRIVLRLPEADGRNFAKLGVPIVVAQSSMAPGGLAITLGKQVKDFHPGDRVGAAEFQEWFSETLLNAVRGAFGLQE